MGQDDNPPAKVLHVIRRLDLARGAERIVAELVRNVPDHDVLVFDGGPSAYDLGEGTVHRARNIVHAAWLCRKMLRRYGYGYLHLHLPPSIYLAILFGARAVVHEHSTRYFRKTRLLPRISSWLTMRRAGKVIAVSEAARQSIIERFGRTRGVFAVPNFVPRLPQSDHEESISPKLVMVAAFDRPKRQDLVIRALTFLPEEFEVDFAGRGPGLSTCRKLAEDLGVAHRVHFLGSVRNISDVYSQAHLCLLISDWEGFGLVAMEAAQFGKATIVSDIDGLRENIVDSRLVFEGEDPRVLAATIVGALGFCRKDDFRQMLADVAESFAISHYASRLTEIYRD